MTIRDQQRLKQVKLPHKDFEALKGLAALQNLTVSELSQKIIVDYIGKLEKDKKSRFYSLLAQSALNERRGVWLDDSFCEQHLLPASKKFGVSETCIVYSALKLFLRP